MSDAAIPDDICDNSDVSASERSTAKLSQDATALIDAITKLPTILRMTSGQYSIATHFMLPREFSLECYASRIVSSAASPGNDDCLGTDNFISQFSDAPTRLERLIECFAPVPYDESGSATPCSPELLPRFPTIALVSKAFNLNFWQHAAFEVAARHLLYAYSKDIENALDGPMYPASFISAPYELRPQLIAYLGGEAGTGKSTVVHALLTLAKKWERVGSVETMAFTGVAAINIKGKTMHSARNLQLSGAEPNAAPTIAMKTRYSRVVLVIIDEISITDQALLGGADAASRSMSSTPRIFMGGKHTLLIGDWLQLPPVGGSPCFQIPPTSANRLRHAGFALYAAINFVIFLTKNMRARLDAQYTTILDGVRWGRLSDEQLAALNTRAEATIQRDFSTNSDQDSFYRPVVVCTNKLRCAINHNMILRIAVERGLPLYECLAVPTSRSRSIVEHLTNANDDLTDRIPMKLLFYIGMPVMISRKHPILLDADIIANGVIGTIVGVHPPPETLEVTTYGVSGVEIHRFTERPELLLIKLHGSHSTLVSGFPDGVIGLPPLHTRLQLRRIPNLARSSITVTQFAVVPAFSCTTEKNKYHE